MQKEKEYSNKIHKKTVEDYFENLKANCFEEVDLEDFEFDKETNFFYYPCPCGDRFEISIEDLEIGEEIATCPSCSLFIKVVYDEDSLAEILSQ